MVRTEGRYGPVRIVPARDGARGPLSGENDAPRVQRLPERLLCLGEGRTLGARDPACAFDGAHPVLPCTLQERCGAPNVLEDLREEGIREGKKRVARLIKAEGLRSVCRRMFVMTTRRDADAQLAPAQLRRRKYLSTEVLIIDELGFEPMNRQDASLFSRLLTYRYGRGAFLITTNKSVREWTELLAGDEVLATKCSPPPCSIGCCTAQAL